MSEKAIVQYVGFEAKASAREYTFMVREVSSEPCEYTVCIENEAFVSRRARYQDAPGICSVKLKRELAACPDHSGERRFEVAQSDLDDYHNARMPRERERQKTLSSK